MKGIRKRAVLLLSLLALLALIPVVSLACGGFFCTNTPIDQGAERIIFTVNGDGTITAIVGINYVGAAADFSWVVPVPSPPALDVAEVASLNALDVATAVQVNNPPQYCNGIFPQPCCFGGGGDGGYLAEGNVGPYDYAIIRNEDAGEMVQWLRDNGYRITEDMEPLIEVYVEEGMYFLAMKLSQDRDVGDIQPVLMTYESEKPMIPIRLTAVAAIEDMPIITWIFADTQYAPENYAHPTPDFSSYRAPGEIATDSFGNYFFWSGNGLYQTEQMQIQDEYEGLAFITQYAGPTANLRDLTQEDVLFEQLIERFPYLTRLRAQMSPDQMTVDPVFAPAPNAPDVSNIVNLADYVDPLEYWGCSSRTALSEATRAKLPGAFTRVDDLQFHVAHPDDWVLSEFDIGEQHFGAFAPDSVSADTLATFFAGEDTAPMLVFTETNEFIDGFGNTLEQEFLERLGQSLDASNGSEIIERIGVRVRYWPNSGYGNYLGLRAVLFGMLASPQQWEENRDLYDAMLAYADSYQYFLRPDRQHTLFLRMNDMGTNLLIAYPDGWVESVGAEGDVFISPLASQSEADTPFIQLTDLNRPMARGEKPLQEVIDEAICWAVDHYGLAVEEATTYISDTWFAYCDSQTHTAPIPFERHGRRGYVRFMNNYVVSASAPTDDFAQYADLLLKMLADMETVDCPML